MNIVLFRQETDLISIYEHFCHPPPKKKIPWMDMKDVNHYKVAGRLGFFFFICNSAKLYFNPETYITLVYTSLFNLIGMFYRNKLILIKFTLLFIVKYHIMIVISILNCGGEGYLRRFQNKWMCFIWNIMNDFTFRNYLLQK